jgi:hypothetical protein
MSLTFSVHCFAVSENKGAAARHHPNPVPGKTWLRGAMGEPGIADASYISIAGSDGCAVGFLRPCGVHQT